MRPTLIIANLKSNKTSLEAQNWLQGISNITRSASSGQAYQISNITDKEIIICPSFTLLSMFKEFIRDQKLPIKLGAQDISQFNEGAYTGEVNGKQIKEFADYVIIGHSERRQNFNETDEVLSKKVSIAINYNLTPIFCVQDENGKIPQGVSIIAYEPVFAIGSGNPDNPQNADKIARNLKTQENVKNVLYGGSVTGDNVKNFTEQESIDGVLVGGASLEASEFIKIIENA